MSTMRMREASRELQSTENQKVILLKRPEGKFPDGRTFYLKDFIYFRLRKRACVNKRILYTYIDLLNLQTLYTYLQLNISYLPYLSLEQLIQVETWKNKKEKGKGINKADQLIRVIYISIIKKKNLKKETDSLSLT